MKTMVPCSLVLFYGFLLPLSAQETNEPFVQLKQELEALTGRDFRVHSLRVIHLVTDAEDQHARNVLQHLFKIMPKMRAYLQFPKDAPFPEAGVMVAMFRNRDDCRKFIEARGQTWNGSFAYLHDPLANRRAVAAYVLPEAPLLSRLRHEALLYMFYAWFEHPPLWLAEGLGECAEQFQLDAEEQIRLGPLHGQLRDFRKFVGTPERPQFTLRQLFALDREAWRKDPRTAYLQAWAFCRFMLESDLLQQARLLPRILMKLKPGSSEAENVKLAIELIQEDEWETLQQAWQAWLNAAQETSAEVSYRTGLALLEGGDSVAATAKLAEAIAQDPVYERLHYFHALACYRSGDPATAIRSLREALLLFPEYDAARYLRALCFLQLCDKVEAATDLKLLLNSPYGDRAREQLDRLQ